MPGADFLDSNIFIYAFDRRDEAKRETAVSVITQANEAPTGVISFQVVQETLNALTTKVAPGLTAAQAEVLFHEVLRPLWRVMPSAALYGRALHLQERYRYTFYDSLIIAAALEAGCERLRSEDLQHGQEIEGLRIENPFLAD